MTSHFSTPTISIPHLTQSGTSNNPSTDLSAPFPSGTQSNDKATEYPKLIYCMLAGGFGGMIGDTSMHSLDTVKTRQQAAPHIAKYQNTLSAYSTIFRQEGFAKGLYSGYAAAMLGSFPSAAAFFVTYEKVKRTMIDDYGVNDTVSYLSAGFLGDLASSIFYVPSEVLKTRLQLQGRYNNPHFESGYNYSSTMNAIQTIVKEEGWHSLFYGYKATLIRDLPFSALQFAFYEKFRELAFDLQEQNSDSDMKRESLSLMAELLTGAAAGGLAGTLTTPLDVIKTRKQTQINTPTSSETSIPSPTKITSASKSSSSTELLESTSILRSLFTVYRNQGFVGLFSGVGPRFVWTSVQSSVMLLLYQVTLRTLSTGQLTLEV